MRFADRGPGRRLLRICDFLPPDFGAVGQYAVLFSRREAEAGDEVVLIGLTTGKSSVETEKIGSGSVCTVRLHVAHLDKSSLVKRLLWTLFVNIRLVFEMLKYVHKCDEVHFTGSPPFLVHFLVPINFLVRRTLVYQITDFYPECIMATMRSVPWPLHLFSKLTNVIRRRVQKFEVLGYDQQRRLADIGIPLERMTIRRDLQPVEIRGNERPLPRPPQAEGKALLLYSGNFGVAHEVKTFVEGYLRHHREGSGSVVLWLNAVGANADLIENSLREAGVPVVRSRPVPLEELASLIVTPDAHLISLRDEFVGYVMPSKTYACVASGKPVIFIGSSASDVHYLCQSRMREDTLYRQVPVGDISGVFQALEELGQAVSQVRAA